MEERRSLQRFDLSAPAHVTVRGNGHRTRELNLATKDVSSGGAFILSSEPIANEARVTIELLMSFDTLQKIAGMKKKARIRVKGKVVRVTAEGIAVRFDSAYKMTTLENGNFLQKAH